MKLSYSIYAQTGDELKRSTLEFLGNNKVILRQIVDKFATVPLTWYTVYDYKELSYVKLDNNSDQVISKGRINKAVWRVDQATYNYSFIEHTSFKGIDSINVKEIVKITQKQENIIKILSSSIFTGFLDIELIQYLPLSSFKLLGIEFEGYGIVCEKKMLNGINDPVTLKVTKISK